MHKNTGLNTVQFSCGCGSMVAMVVDATTSSESKSVAAWKMAERWFLGQSLALLASSIADTYNHALHVELCYMNG